MKVAIGCDHGGFALKEAVRAYLEQNHIDYKDFGAYSEESVDYAPIAAQAARYVASGQADRGVLICSTGIGISIAANKVRGHPGSPLHQRILRRDDPPPQRRQHPVHGRQGGGPGDRRQAAGDLPRDGI